MVCTFFIAKIDLKLFPENDFGQFKIVQKQKSEQSFYKKNAKNAKYLEKCRDIIFM